jgi:hypothetical protein
MQTPYMLQNLQFRPPVCIISPQHRSLMESKTWKNITPTIVSYWRSRRTTATTQFSKHLTPSTMDTMHKLQTCLLSFSNPSSYPPPTASRSSPLCILEALLGTHSLRCPPVSHNTNNKSSYSQPLIIDSNEINFAACTEKVDDDIQQNLNPENEHGVHTMKLQMIPCPVTLGPL